MGCALAVLFCVGFDATIAGIILSAIGYHLPGFVLLIVGLCVLWRCWLVSATMPRCPDE